MRTGDRAALRPQPFDDPVAGQPRQHHVEDDDVVTTRPGHREPLLAVVGDVHVDALGAQPALDRAGEPHLVVHDQHAHAPSLPYQVGRGGRR